MADVLSNRSVILTTVEVFSIIIFNVLSLTGNIMVCIAVYKNTRLRTTTNLYIIALAVSDLMSGVFVMPFTMGVLIKGAWVYGRVICNFQAYIGMFVVYVSPATMGLTAINRYMRICKSEQQYKRIFSPWKSRALLACVWILVACYIPVPKLTGLQDYVFVPGYAVCVPAHLNQTGKVVHFAIVLCFFLITPLLITTFSYIRIAKMIRQHNAAMSSTIHRGRTGSSINVQELRLSKSLFVVVFAFMICWIPFWVVAALRGFNIVTSMPRNIKLLSSFCIYLSHAINPFIYAGMNRTFRSEFRKIFCCERTQGSSTANTHRIVNQIPDRGEGKEGSKCTAEILLDTTAASTRPEVDETS